MRYLFWSYHRLRYIAFLVTDNRQTDNDDITLKKKSSQSLKNLMTPNDLGASRKFILIISGKIKI